MALIKSISGIRGTIGGLPGQGLTPVDLVALAAAYGRWLKKAHPTKTTVVIGRDGRITGPIVQSIVMETLRMMGIDIIDAGLSTTPTIEMAVKLLGTSGGIIITASHNPMNWNALKLLNAEGEFLNADEGKQVLKLASSAEKIEFAEVTEIGKYSTDESLLSRHINAILNLDYVDVQGIKNANLHVVVDPINSSGAIAIPALLDALGVGYYMIHGEIQGVFGHNPEPLAAHLKDLSDAVVEHKADFGVSVDPDVDRLALVCEDGTMFGEENTLVAVADYMLAIKPGPTVSNLSSSRALRDVTERFAQIYTASAVGEVNVVAMMKATQAVLGGEGNGGVILPDLHFGRDALAGLALILSYFVKRTKKLSEIKSALPIYHMSKKKVNLQEGVDPQHILDYMKVKYANHEGLNVIDGVKIDFDEAWIHMRKSNTEPIIRIYAEAPTMEEANKLTTNFINEILATARP